MLKEEILESGDVLIVTELDRLGRNKEATLKELRFFKDNGIRVMVLELPTTLIDLSAMENSMARMMLETINNMMIELYASMAKSKLVKVCEKVEEKVVSGYNKIEDGVVNGYKKVEETFVGGYKKIEDGFVDQFLTKDGETVEEAKERLRKNKAQK